MNTYAFLVKAKAKSEKKNLFCWFSSKSDSRAEREMLNILDDADIEVGRGADHQLPQRTDWFVVDDLPEEGVLDDTWCDRYELKEDGRTWQLKPDAALVSAVENAAPDETVAPVAPEVNVEVSPAPADDLRPLARLRLPQRLIAHLLNDAEQDQISLAQHTEIGALEFKEEDSHVQGFLKAIESTPGIRELSAHVEWKLVKAVKKVFPLDREHDAELIARFVTAWVQAESGDRNQLVEDWMSGEVLSKANNAVSLPTGNDLQIGEHDDENTRYPVVRMSFRKRLLSQFTAEELRHHLTRAEYEEVSRMEMDTDDSYVQNLLLAAENCEEVKGYDTKDLWRYTDAIRKVFSQEKRHELALVLRFTRKWAATDYIDRGLLAKEWAKGNRVSAIQRTDRGTNAGGGIKTDRNADYEHTLDTLDIEIACATLPMDFDIYNIPGSIHRRAKEIVAAKESPFKEWSAALRKTAGILDFSRAAIFALIREASEGITTFPDRLSSYIRATLTEYQHDKPTSEILAAARQIDSAAVVAGVIQGTQPVESLEALSTEFSVVGKAAVEAAQKNASEAVEKPEVKSMGGGVFSIDGLMASPSNEVVKTENVEIAGDVQMETDHGNEAENGDALPESKAAVLPNAGANEAGAQTAPLTKEAILSTYAPTLAKAVADQSNQISPEPQQPEPDAHLSEPETEAPVATEWPAYFEPGRYECLPNNVYHAANGISSTQVKDARVSLMFYHGRHVTNTIRRESSEALTFGRLAHTLALEPEKLHEEFAVFPGVPEEAFTTADSMKAFIREFNADKPKAEQLKLTGKKEDLQAAIRAVNPDAIFADEFEQQWRDSVAGKTILSSEQLALATAIQQALLNHESAGKLLSHPSRSVETSYFGMDDETGLEVRVRPDLEVEINGVRIGVDLKTISMGRVKQDGLRAKLHREIIDRDYHLSAGMYCSVADFDQFFWIFVNKDEGYHWVAVIEASEDLLALGVQEYQKTMRALAQAYDTNCWPAPITEDYTDELNDFDLRRLEALRAQA